MIPIIKPLMDEREAAAARRVILSGWVTQGPEVAAFEREFADFVGAAHAVAVSSCTTALHLALLAAGVQPGDEVVTVSHSYIATANAVRYCGATPVFVDVEPDTFNIDVAGIEAMISPRTKAILAPNLIGNAPDWDRIRAIADAHGLKVIEDSCDALGATLRGTPTGTRSDISVTSFALAHVITAAATGGMVLLDDDDLIDRCVLLRRWGRRSETQFYGSKKGDKRFFTEVDGIEYDNLFIFDEVGWNFEPCEISAAFGNVQLRRLPANLARRQRNFDVLSAFFGTYPGVFTLPRQLEGLETGWHMFPILLRPESGIRRGDFQEHMEGHGIDTRMVWTGNVLRQPAFAKIEHRAAPGGYPNADRVMEHGLVLPSHHGLTDDDVAYIGETLDDFLARAV
jgi:CDP-6-deoxy-D-xylo-4-hexulose-3-dehydrase